MSRSNKMDNSVSEKNSFSFSPKKFQDFMATPPNKRRKFLQSDRVVPVKENVEKICNDYKQFYNTIESELHNSENWKVLETTDFLHDNLFNVTLQSGDVKVADTLLPPMTNVSTLHCTDDEWMDMKDPLTDPLFIKDREEKDFGETFTDSECKLRRSCRLKKNVTENVNKEEHNLSVVEKHILKKLENIEEEEEFPLNIIQQLASLHIKLMHKVPPQHKIETTGAHATTERVKTLFKKYGPLRKGPYSPVEDKVIVHNWEIFCKHHDWDPKNIKPFLFWRHNGKYYIRSIEERQRFVQFLANGLPWRTLYSVYTRFKVLHCNRITNTRYTSKEDNKILTYIENKYLDNRDTKFIELAKLLGRTARSISKRYKFLKRTYHKSMKNSNVEWTVKLIKQFIKALLSVTLSENIEELKYATLPMPVWRKVGEKLNIDENILKTFWQHQLHLQLFSTSPIYLNDIRIQLIEYIYKKGISNTREIIWPNVTQYFNGATAVFLCKSFYYLVQECDMDTNNFADVVEFLYHKKIPEIKSAPTDKFLPRILYKDGEIEILTTEDDTIDTNTAD